MHICTAIDCSTRHLQVTFLLCAAAALCYGHVEVITTEHSSADNSVLDGEAHFPSTSGMPVTEVPTTGAPLPTYSTTEESLTTGKVPSYVRTSTAFAAHPHTTRMPHQFSTAHGSAHLSGAHSFQHYPLQYHPHIAPYHSYGVHPFWYNRYNGYGMQRPFMMSPYAALQSHPMPPLVIVKLLQPIVLPIAKNVHEEKSPKAEIDIETERITHNGHAAGYNRFGHREGHGRFMQHFNSLGQGYNRFGQGMNRFGNGFHQFGHGMSSMGMIRAGNGFNHVEHGMSPMAMNRFGNGFNQFGHGMNSFGMNRYGHGFNRFTQEPNHFHHQGFSDNRFRSARSGMAEHSSPMDEDQDMHITVKLH